MRTPYARQFGVALPAGVVLKAVAHRAFATRRCERERSRPPRLAARTGSGEKKVALDGRPSASAIRRTVGGTEKALRRRRKGTEPSFWRRGELENLGRVLPSAARRYGNKTALVSGGREFGFEELSDHFGRAGNAVRVLGV